MRVSVLPPRHPKFYPPLKGDKWWDGEVEAYGRNVDGTYWVRLALPNGSKANFSRVPMPDA